MAVEQAIQIDKQVRIEAPPEVVFEYFTDPDKMIRWKGQRAELDPRPGGTYRVTINEHVIARGAYVEIDPPTRIVFTWGWEGGQSPVGPGSSTVEITLEPDGDGTLVRLTHRDLPEDQVGQHTDGWNHYLERLTIAAGGGDPGVDPKSQPQQ